MARTFVTLLVIFFIYGQANAFISFSDIKTLYDWGDKLLTKGLQLYNTKKAILRNDAQKMNHIIKKLDKISSDLKEISSNIGAKLDAMMKTILKTIRSSVTFQLKKKTLTDYIDTVNRFYIDAIDYTGSNKTYSIDTLNNFANLVLSTSDNLPAVLQKIHQLITNTGPAGFLPLLLRDDKEHVSIDCDRNISPQQNVYYTYISLLIAEMKGLSILNQVYFIKQINNKNQHNYGNELTLARDRYKRRIISYKNVILRYLSQFPRTIHRCSVTSPKRDVHYLELLWFSRASLFGEGSLMRLYGRGIRCQSHCDWITRESDYEILPNNHRIEDCKDISRGVTVCPANPGSSRQYLWWKGSSVTYGHDDKKCNNQRELSSRTAVSDTIIGPVGNPCNMCACSMYVNNEKSNGTKWYINRHPQFSDINNDMVVTGVRFIKKGNTISLQIQQNKFSSGAMTNNTGQWLEPKEGIKSLVSYNRRSMYLDDIILLDNHVVTGVKFELADNPVGFQLQVHGNPFDFRTGELNPLFGGWFEPEQFMTMDLPSYDRKRIEIDMGDADDPARGSDFDYDSDTNKFVKFKHTSIHKDAGQTTIPLIETLPAVSQKPIPLSGVGISYKGSHGFGGYIAPRIYTMDIPL